MSRGCVGRYNFLVITVVVDNALHAGPRVLDVVKVPPQVAPLSYG